MIILHRKFSYRADGWGYGGASSSGGVPGFILPFGVGSQSTKFNVEDPISLNTAYGAVISPWGVPELVAALNGAAGGAPSPYDTTVWGALPAPDVGVTVVSGPVPVRLTLVSIGVTIPMTNL